MSDRKACEQWMSGVEKSGGFQAWLERQNSIVRMSRQLETTKQLVTDGLRAWAKCCQLFMTLR
ncbi:hypothetical protein DPMN_152864 [Dreissena polymorpha]|uniref:Uncharacterized protein n=1 Tax=Dreissena polymorpha TaxID=45954 RepID=A0A9D4FL69_DREPO|nr:hypothetical protein DPMN_152864 [Dreissena polymorpha]